MVSRDNFVSLSSIRSLTRQWVGRLSHYRLHANDEHYEALVSDGLKFVGLALEDSLSNSTYWVAAPLRAKLRSCCSWSIVERLFARNETAVPFLKRCRTQKSGLQLNPPCSLTSSRRSRSLPP